MQQKEYKKFQAKAHRIIVKHTSRQELIDDFPSYAMISLLRCGSRSWKYILVDFFREYDGRMITKVDGTKLIRPKHNGELVCIDYVPDIEEHSMHLDEIVFLSEFREVALNSIGNPQMREVVELYFWGHLTCRKIGEMKDLTESRVSQILNKAIKKLKNTKQIEVFNK